MTATDQEVKAFTDREVFMNADDIVETLFSIADVDNKINVQGFEFDDIENLYMTDAELEEEGWDDPEEARYDGYDYKEVGSWWFVSGDLFNNLKDLGEVVLETDRHYLWGRAVRSEPLWHDWAIVRIYENLSR